MKGINTDHVLKFHSYDSGFARVYYTYVNENRDKFFYCFQQDFKDKVEFYNCSGSDSEFCEPEYPVKFKVVMTVNVKPIPEVKFNDMIIDLIIARPDLKLGREVC